MGKTSFLRLSAAFAVAMSSSAYSDRTEGAEVIAAAAFTPGCCWIMLFADDGPVYRGSFNAETGTWESAGQVPAGKSIAGAQELQAMTGIIPNNVPEVRAILRR